MICPKCHKKVLKDSVYCSECGHKLSQNEKENRMIQDSNYNELVKETNEKKLIQEVNEKKSKTQIDAKRLKRIILMVLATIVSLLVAGILIKQTIQTQKAFDDFSHWFDEGEYTLAENQLNRNINNASLVRKVNKYSKQGYVKSLEENDEDKCVSIYNAGLLSDEYMEQIEITAIEKMENLQEKYKLKEIDYETVKSICVMYERYNNSELSSSAKTIKSWCEQVNESRVGFDKGMSYYTNQDYGRAVASLSKVIKEDENYSQATKIIAECLPLFKDDVFQKVELAVEENQYSNALTLLQELQKYCTDTDVDKKIQDIKAKRQSYEQEQEKKKIEKLKNDQEVKVTSARAYNDGYYVVMMQAEVIIKNTTNKVAKDVSFGLLLFDGNGYPVDVEYSMYQGTYENEFNCEHGSCNVTAGSSYGWNRYFSLPDNCKKVKACVRRVEYTDGTTWNNPYYDYWVKENYSKY